MTKTALTVKQILDLGLWDKVCEYKDWNPWILNEGRISEDELVTFDSEFKKEIIKVKVKWRDILNCKKMFPANIYKCQEIAKEIGYDYILFNGLIYSVHDCYNYIGNEDDLTV